MKALVVFYSRAGTTWKLAEAIGCITGWDVEELIDTRPRGGILGYLRSALDGTFERLTELRPPRANPAEYDLVVVGSPVWNSSLSSRYGPGCTNGAGAFPRSPSSSRSAAPAQSVRSARWRASPAASRSRPTAPRRALSPATAPTSTRGASSPC